MPGDLDEPQVYDVSRASVIIDGHKMTGFSEDGFGLTPTQENSIIKGLIGEIGVNIDPTSGAEATISLKSTSLDNEFLRDLKKRQDAREVGPVQFEIQIDPTEVDGVPVHQKAHGFAKKGMVYAWIMKWPEQSTDGHESPSIEWEFVGYGYYEE